MIKPLHQFQKYSFAKGNKPLLRNPSVAFAKNLTASVGAVDNTKTSEEVALLLVVTDSEVNRTVDNYYGINFKHFMKLFSKLDELSAGEKIPIYCSGITDNDPP